MRTTINKSENPNHNKPNLASIAVELAVLYDESIWHLGREFVQTNPAWKDMQSKRRQRLVKTYNAIRKGAYIQ